MVTNHELCRTLWFPLQAQKVTLQNPDARVITAAAHIGLNMNVRKIKVNSTLHRATGLTAHPGANCILSVI